MGWFLAASSMGYVVALLVGGVVVERAGWRAALFALALGPLLCFLLSIVLFYGDRSRRVAPPGLRRLSFNEESLKELTARPSK